MLKSSVSSRKKSVKEKGVDTNKVSKRGTILRAVPGAMICATATLSPIERDMATLPNQEILANIGTVNSKSPTSPGGLGTRTENRRNSKARSNGTALATIPARMEMHFPELKGTIGIYKHGRIQWEHKDNKDRSPTLGSRSLLCSTKNRRPRIQVVIPNGQRSRALPTSPFFGQATFNVATNPDKRSSSVGQEYAHDVSPPSGSKRTLMRDSVVSPLSTQQHQHTVPLSHPLMVPQSSPPNSRFDSPSIDNVPSLSNSSDEYHEDDTSSSYSKRSSLTSNEAGGPPKLPTLTFQERTASSIFSVKSPLEAGIFDDDASMKEKPEDAVGETGAAVPGPLSHPPRRYAPHPSIERDTEFRPTCAHRPLRASPNTLQLQPTTTHRASKRCSHQKSISDDPIMGVINQAIRHSKSAHFAHTMPSPTLSEAEHDLEEHLTTFTDDDPFKWDSVVPRIDEAPECVPDSSPLPRAFTPPVPRKSSKRHADTRVPNFRLSNVPGGHIVSQLQRNRPAANAKGLTIDIPGTSKRTTRMTDDFELSPISISPNAVMPTITPDVAENVILTILRHHETLDDLFATAVLNRGFYRVFKRHELDLMTCVLRKMSPPAWEHLEICYPGHDQCDDEHFRTARQRTEYTPATYLQSYMRNLNIIATIKLLIKDKCQSFLRPEIAAALVSEDPSESARADDALWRIWTFCKIFGSGKGREEDIVAQMDWLRGGVLVHQKTCTFSILSTESIDMNGALASAPECFGKGNEDGLTAEQLFDMMELWNCLGVLLQPFEGRTIQAREYGIYENTHIRGGDIDGEEEMLDEWCYYLLTLGLSTIVDLAGPCCRTEPTAFILAAQNGWIDWSPPVFGGTRRHFLKEAASRVYEDKIAIVYAASSTKEVQRQLSKQRIQQHITELRKRKNTGQRLAPVRISQAQERPMSEWEDVINNLTRPRPQPSTSSNLVSHIPGIQSRTPTSGLAQEVFASTFELPASKTPPTSRSKPPRSPSARIVAQPLLPTPPPSTVPSTPGERRSSIAPNMPPSMPPINEHPAFRHRSGSVPEMPSLADHPAFAQHARTQTGSGSIPSTTESNTPSHPSEEHPAFQQHQLQHTIYSSDVAENTADKAVYRIVEMGFTPDQARHALRMTDLGDGLRVDRAVELLLRAGT